MGGGDGPGADTTMYGEPRAATSRACSSRTRRGTTCSSISALTTRRGAVTRGEPPRCRPASPARAPRPGPGPPSISTPAADERPRDHGVGVPHLAGAAARRDPHTGVGTPGSTSSTRASHGRIVADPDRPAHGRVQVGDPPAEPTADLVAEHPPPPEPREPDRPTRHHAAAIPVRVGDRSLLDDVAPLGHPDDQRRVEQIAPGTTVPPRTHGLEDAAAPAHHVGVGAERDPVQIHARCHRVADGRVFGGSFRHRPHERAAGGARRRSSRPSWWQVGLEVDEAVGLAREADLLDLGPLLGEAARRPDPRRAARRSRPGSPAWAAGRPGTARAGAA